VTLLDLVTMKAHARLLLITCLGSHRATSYRIVIDLNTYDADDMAFAAAGNLACDGVWAVNVNSPGVTAQEWSAGISGVNQNYVISEDQPGEYSQCKTVRDYAGGRLDNAFGYHECQQSGCTVLTNDEVNAYAANCGTSVLALTRAYWSGTAWRTNVQSILGNPNLYGVAMEFQPNDLADRSQAAFINAVLSKGHSPLLLLPFQNSVPPEIAIDRLIDFLIKTGAQITDPRVVLVLARYDQPFVPIQGTSGSLAAALKVAKGRREQLNSNSTINITTKASAQGYIDSARGIM
jgi:hypothetical protein